MIIELASVEILPKKINAKFAPGEIDLDSEGNLVSDAILDAEAVSKSGKVHIGARLTADIALDCTRCLEAVRKPLEIDFDSVFVEGAEDELEDKLEIAGEDLAESFVAGGIIDLKEVVREQLLLNLPEQVYCRDDCRGLCPKCGANRNLIDCRCDDDEVDPRWAALKSLR